MKLTKEGAKIALIITIIILIADLMLLTYLLIKEAREPLLLSPEEANIERTISVISDEPTLSQVTLKIRSSEKALIVHEIVPEGSVLYPITTQTNYTIFSFKQSNNSWFVADSEPLINLEIKYITNSSSAIRDITQISYVNQTGDIISGIAQTTTLGGGTGNTGTTTSSGSGGSGGGGSSGGGSSGGGSPVRVNNNSGNAILNDKNIANSEIMTIQKPEAER